MIGIPLTIDRWFQVRAFRNGRKDWRTWRPWTGKTRYTWTNDRLRRWKP